jgi:predicted ester cyclase
VSRDNVVAEGNVVAERRTARAAHKGEFMGILHQ